MKESQRIAAGVLGQKAVWFERGGWQRGQRSELSLYAFACVSVCVCVRAREREDSVTPFFSHSAASLLTGWTDTPTMSPSSHRCHGDQATPWHIYPRTPLCRSTCALCGHQLLVFCASAHPHRTEHERGGDIMTEINKKEVKQVRQNHPSQGGCVRFWTTAVIFTFIRSSVPNEAGDIRRI